MPNIEMKTLNNMIAELRKAPSLYFPSEFWKKLNKLHKNQLLNKGFDNFKRSITQHYFNWKILMIMRHQLSPIISGLRKGNFSPIFNSRFLNPRMENNSHLTSFNKLSSYIYGLYVAYLRDYISHKDKFKLLDKLDEPLVGNPFLVEYKGKNISQDLCNSIHEFYSVFGSVNPQKLTNVAELGAGYGRLAYVFLKALPKSSYCIIDIPPALFISQEYLVKVFPKETIFCYRSFSSFKEIRREFEAARIKFIMAHQIELMPKKYFDLVISVSTLHEMTRKQIENYIYQIDRIANGYFYNKQWRKSYTKDNSRIKENEYPIPKKWQIVYQHRHPIQKLFFEALYKIT